MPASLAAALAERLAALNPRTRGLTSVEPATDTLLPPAWAFRRERRLLVLTEAGKPVWWFGLEDEEVPVSAHDWKAYAR